MSERLDTLLDDLLSEDESTRRFAVEDLGDIGDARAIHPLVSMLGDDSIAAQEATINALSRIGTDQTVVAVLPLLRSEEASERNAACVVLRNIGAPAIAHLSRLLGDQDKDVRKFAVDVLAWIGSPSALDALLGALYDADVNVAVATAEALGRIGHPSAVPAMVGAMTDNNWLRCAVTQSLGQIGGTEALQALHTLINDEDEMVVFTAAQALGAIGDEVSLTHLLGLLKHGNPMIVNTTVSTVQLVLDRIDPTRLQDVRGRIPLQPVVRLTLHPQPALRHSALMLLGRIGGDNQVTSLVAALIAAENSDQEHIRQAAASALLSLSSDNIEPIVTALACSDTSPEGRCELVDVLGRLARPQAFDAVAKLLDDSDVRVRRVACRILPDLNGERAGAVLSRSLADTDGHVRAHAVRGLGALLAKQALPLIRPSSEVAFEAVHKEVASTVGTIGGHDVSEGITALARLLNDPYPDVREAAARALALIGNDVAIDVLISAARTGREDQRALALRELAHVQQTEPVTRMLRCAMLDPSPAVCADAIHSVAVAGPSHLTGEMVAQLWHEEARVRCEMVRLLGGQLPGTRGDRLLTLFQTDPSAKVRYECARALSRLNPEGAEDAMLSFLGSDHAAPLVILGAIEALGRIGTSPAVEVLLGWAANDDAEIAEAATRAMAAIMERKVAAQHVRHIAATRSTHDETLPGYMS